MPGAGRRLHRRRLAVAAHAPQHSDTAQRRVPRVRHQAVHQRQQVRVLPAAGDRVLAVLRRAQGRAADDHHRSGPAGQATGQPGGARGIAEHHVHAQHAAVRARKARDAAVLGRRVPGRQGVGEPGPGGARQGRAGAARVRRGRGRAAHTVRDRGRQRRRRVHAEDGREHRGQHHQQVVLQGRAPGHQEAAGPRAEARVRSDRAGGRRQRHRQGVHQDPRGRGRRERQQPRVRAVPVQDQRGRVQLGPGQRHGGPGAVLGRGPRGGHGRGRRPRRVQVGLA